MKIALLTIHYANSYGGTLQALSSQYVLSEYGDVTIINYRTQHLDKSLNVIRYGLRLRDFLRMGKDFFRLLPRYRLVNKFKKFYEDYYNLSKLCKNARELRDLENSFDVFVCGSDQIWNPNVIEGFDESYQLNFIQNKKKISFASSAGSYQFDSHERKLLAKNLGEFSYLSVREEELAETLHEIIPGKKVTHVIDPTLMLDKQAWSRLLHIKGKNKREKYIFVYTLKKDTLARKVVDEVAKFYGYKVIAIDQDPFVGYHVDNHIKDASPRDYVELLMNASFVVTNSFHGTVFSSNFSIPFVVVKPESGLNRIKGFLESVGLEERLVLKADQLSNILKANIDFEYAQFKLESLRASTRKYLMSALG